MKASRLLIAAAVAVSAFAVQADEADGSQYANNFTGTLTRAEVQAQLNNKPAGVSPWSIQYNPLAQFKSSRTRAQVQADYIANRDAVAAFTSEDSGSAYLAASPATGNSRFAGQPTPATGE
jgi:hypothetical protein